MSLVESRRKLNSIIRCCCYLYKTRSNTWMLDKNVIYLISAEIIYDDVIHDIRLSNEPN